MAINKQKKEELVAEFTEMVAGAKAMVFVSFKTLSVNKTVALRKKLHNENVGYKVTKKTLLKRALEAQKTEGEFPEVLGELAVAYSADALTPARLMFEAMKENKGKMEILGGVFEGKFIKQKCLRSQLSIKRSTTIKDCIPTQVSNAETGYRGKRSSKNKVVLYYTNYLVFIK